MVVRRKDKEFTDLLKARDIILDARKRAVGQSYKDDGGRYTKPTKISYTKRERKMLNKIAKRVGMDKIKSLESSTLIGLSMGNVL